MRLTKKTEYGYEDTDECVITTCSDKLGQLEDIEEELGVDLIVVWKSIKNGFYSKDELGNIFFVPSDVMKPQYEYNLKAIKKFNSNYGKTWALTKEELL